MTEKTEKKPRRPRNVGELMVQVQQSDNTWDDLDLAIDGDPDSTAGALKWIKDKGDAGKTYRVARVYPAVKVGVVTSEVRTLAPAD